jgi:hypothetical protein
MVGMSRKLYASATERMRAYRKRRREREYLGQELPVTVPAAVWRDAQGLPKSIAALAAICDRGCSRLRMDAQPWMLGAVDASRAHELLGHIQSELKRLAGQR